MELRDRIEANFESFGSLIIRHRWLAVLFMLLLTFGLGSGMSRLTLDTSPTSYISMSDPARITYNKYRSLFENDDVYLIVVRSNDIYSRQFLSRLNDFHKDLEDQVPHLDKVTSLVNARVVRGENDELIVDELLEPFPVSPQELALVKSRVRDNPMFVNALVSEDEKAVAIVVNIVPDGQEQISDSVDMALGFDVDSQKEEEIHQGIPSAQGVSQPQLIESMEVLQNLEQKYQADDFKIYISGDLQITYGLMHILTAESQKFVGITMAVIGFILLLLFRRISGVLLPLLVVVLPIASTIGFMGWVGLPMTMSTGSMPTFLFAVCVGDAVHVLSVFYQRLRAGESKNAAITYTMGHSGLAILMTSVTTAGALGTFMFSDLMPVAGLGIAAPVGVMLAFVYSVILLPALLAILPIRALKSEQNKPSDESILTRVLVGLGKYCTSHASLVVTVWVIVAAISLYGAMHVQVTHEPIKWFPVDAPTRIAAEVANSDMKGAMPLELVIDSGKENGLFDPDVIDRIDQVEAFVKQLRTDTIQVGQTMSIVQIIKETNKALHNNDPDYYRIPESRELISQELLLFESSSPEELERVVDSQYRYARIHASLPFENGLHYIPFVEKLEAGARPILGEDLALESSGLIQLYMRSFSLMLKTTVNSYTLALLMIAPLMVLLIGELRLGLVSLIPNLAPILVGVGIMYFMEVPFDMVTMTIGTIVIGIAVDDTIHFMHSFRRYYRGGDDAVTAVSKTLHSTGKALVITSTALCAGFFVQMSGEMVSINNSGMITGLAILVALLADLTLSPALVVIATRRAERKIAGV